MMQQLRKCDVWKEILWSIQQKIERSPIHEREHEAIIDINFNVNCFGRSTYSVAAEERIFESSTIYNVFAKIF